MASVSFLQNESLVLCVLDFYLDRPVIIPVPVGHMRHSLPLVCRKWRDLALKTSRYWVDFTFNPVSISHPVQHLRHVYQFIQRSNGHPLNFQFPHYTVSEVDSKPIGSPSLMLDVDDVTIPLEQLVYGHGIIEIVNDIIKPYASRVRHLTCLIHGQDNENFLLGIPRGSFKRLESIDVMFINSVRNHRFPFNTSRPPICEVFNGLPGLRVARVRALNGVHPLKFRLPWNYLTILDLLSTIVSADAFLHIVSHASERLVEGSFVVKLHSKWVNTSCRRRPIVMISLDKLHLRILRPHLCQKFESVLAIPIAKYLWIEKEVTKKDWDWDLDHYTHFLSPCSSTLFQLILSYFGPSLMHPDRLSIGRQTLYTEVESLLRMLPNLGELSLPNGISVHTPTLEKLANGRLLPQLHSLELAVLDPYPIFEVVQRRRCMDGPSSVHVSPVGRLNLYMPIYSPSIQNAIIRDGVSLGNENDARITLRFYASCFCTLCFGH